MDFQGNVVEKYRYSVFGEREILSPLGEKRQQSAIANPWQYSGKRFDEESGFIAFGMRYYAPTLGRWTTPDPADCIDGTNLYAYLHNNPLLYVDQYGLFGESLFQPLQDFEWKRRLNDLPFYQSIETTVVDKWNNPRFQGSMQAIGGLAEASFGAGMTYSTAGLAAPVGCAVMAHGLDHFFTGMNSVITGTSGHTVTSQLLQMGGVSPQTANTFDSIISMGGGMTGAKFAVSGAQSAFPQTLKSTGHLAMQEVKNITKGGTSYSNGFLGRKGFELSHPEFQKFTRNRPTLINNLSYSGHALDQMQNRGIMPSVVEKIIKEGNKIPGNRLGTHIYYDSMVNVRVVVNSETGNIVTVIPGGIK